MKNPSSITAAVLIAMALVTSACAGAENGAAPVGYEHASDPSDLVLRVETGGGFVPIEFVFSAHPDFSLLGDGSAITAAAQIAIFPPPALPALQTQTVDEAGIQAILAAADQAGLLHGGRHYDYPCVADAATTTFTVRADGETSVTSVYALGIEGPPGPEEPPPGNGLPPVEEGANDAFMGCELSDDERAARAALFEFSAMLVNLEAWLPAEAVGPTSIYEPEQMRIYVSPYRASEDFAQEAVVWPLDTGLDEFGEPSPLSDDLRCGVLQGDDLGEVAAAAAPTNTMTPWTSAGTEWRLIFRALLPDENGCPAVD